MSIQLCAQAVDLSPSKGVELTSLELKCLQDLREAAAMKSTKQVPTERRTSQAPFPQLHQGQSWLPYLCVLCDPELHLGTWPAAALYWDRNGGCWASR